MVSAVVEANSVESNTYLNASHDVPDNCRPAAKVKVQSVNTFSIEWSLAASEALIAIRVSLKLID